MQFPFLCNCHQSLTPCSKSEMCLGSFHCCVCYMAHGIATLLISQHYSFCFFYHDCMTYCDPSESHSTYSSCNFMVCALNNQSWEQNLKPKYTSHKINLYISGWTNIKRTSVQPYGPRILRNVFLAFKCGGPLSSFGLCTWHESTQVYFYWPGLCFTYWI